MQIDRPPKFIADLVKGIDDAVTLCHTEARAAGWWREGKRNKGELIALMHSELSEMLEGVRKKSMDDHLPDRRSEEVELADLVIRAFDYAGAHNLDVAGAVIAKLEYNSKRDDHKLSERDKPGGKAF